MFPTNFSFLICFSTSSHSSFSRNCFRNIFILETSLIGDGYKLEALMIELLENLAVSAAQSVVSLFLFLLLLIMVFGTLLMKID